MHVRLLDVLLPTCLPTGGLPGGTSARVGAGIFRNCCIGPWGIWAPPTSEECGQFVLMADAVVLSCVARGNRGGAGRQSARSSETDFLTTMHRTYPARTAIDARARQALSRPPDVPANEALVRSDAHANAGTPVTAPGVPVSGKLHPGDGACRACICNTKSADSNMQTGKRSRTALKLGALKKR